MKKIFAVVVVMAVAMVFLGSVNSSEASSEKIYEINFNSVNTSTHKSTTNAILPWIKMVEEKTKGRVKVNMFYNAALGAATNTWQDVGGGSYDLSTANLPYYIDTEMFPLTVANVPFAFPDPIIASKVIKRYGKKYENDIFKKCVWFGTGATDPTQIFTKKPVRTLADLKNMKLRVGGRIDAALVKAWGAIPVSMKFTEQYEAISKNIIDGSIFNPVGAMGNRTYEVAPYITVVNLAAVVFPFPFNRDTFNKFPADLQKLFKEDLGPKLGDLYAESYFNESKLAYEEIKKQVGSKGEIITLSAQDMIKIKEPAKAIWDSWVQEANKKGYQGETMMSEFKKALKDEGVALPF